MSVLPIVDRELRVAARRPKTYRSRCFSAAAALVFAAYFFWVTAHVSFGLGAGRQVFTVLGQLIFLYCLFVGVTATADILSFEKREGTMGLLFLTHLKGYDVVLGKLMAAAVPVLYGVVAAIPASAICLMAGGVQAGEFWRMVLALLNGLFFSLSLGLLVSVLCRSERRAMQSATTLVVVFGFVLGGIGQWLSSKTDAIEVGQLLQAFSPAKTLELSTIPTARSMRHFWWSLLAVHSVSWIMLAGASWILPRAWQDKAPAHEAASWRERWQLRLAGSLARRSAFRLRFLEANPFCWLAARSNLVVWETWIVLGAIVLMAAGTAWFFRGTIPLFVVCLSAIVLLHSSFKGQFCAAACERLATDKQSGSLEVLLATPLSVREILRGQWLALARQFIGPMIAVFLLDLLMLLLVIAANEPEFLQGPEAFVNCVVSLVAALAMLVADAITLGWVGMWQAMAARQLMAARSHALIYVLFLPWIVFVILASMVAFLAMQEPALRELKFHHFLAAWFVLGMANNLLLCLWARRRLFADFRILATERYQPAGRGWHVWPNLAKLFSAFSTNPASEPQTS
jgi:ABC-type transport system involved in multi-copper enzyme maturation permease subunit